jgi:hypothetical protein
MRRLAALACLILSAKFAEASSDSRHKSSASTSDSFRPRAHVARVENYSYESRGGKNEESEDDLLKSSMPSLHKSISEEITASSEEVKELRSTTKPRTLSWKGFDDLDKLIFKTALPLSAIFAIIPLTSAMDLFWVSRLGDALAVAGQSAANQVFNSAFWLFAFLPSVTATLVSKRNASGDFEGVQDAVCQALLFSVFISVIGTALMFLNPAKALSSILKGK